MKVVDHGILFAAAAEFALVEVIEEFAFYPLHARIELSREVECHQYHHRNHGYKANFGRVYLGDGMYYEHDGYQEAENGHYYLRHVAAKAFVALRIARRYRYYQSQEEWRHGAYGDESGERAGPCTGMSLEPRPQIQLRQHYDGNKHYRVEHCAPYVPLQYRFPWPAGGVAAVGLCAIAVDEEA